MGPSSHCHRKSCTALPSTSRPSLRVAHSRPLHFSAPDSPSDFASFRTLKTTQSSNLDPLSFPLLSVSFICASCLAFHLSTFLSFCFRFHSYSFPDFLPASPLQTFRFALLSSSSALLSAFSDQALDRLVSASSHVTMLSPLTYLPCRLQGVLLACAMAVFFLRWASRLDAFSVYPVRTSLPCYAVGTTTVAPVVRSPRSSRTRGNSSHDSCAHDG